MSPNPQIAHRPVRSQATLPERHVAICDLGSNSFRMVVFTSVGQRWRRTDEIYEAVRIGAGVAQTGRLGSVGIERGLAVVEVFDHFCRATGITTIEAIATSAIRDATNAHEFLDRAVLDVSVATTAEEAHFGYLAAANSTTIADGAVLDLGGGSMQLVRVASRHPREIRSWQLGAVRMSERFDLDQRRPPSRKQLDKLREFVAGELAKERWTERLSGRLVGIGGTIRNLAAAIQREHGVPEFGVQGFRLKRSALDDLVAELAAMTPQQRGKVPGIKPARSDLILAGAVVLQTVMAVTSFDELEVTEAGLREGAFFAHHLAGDPPLFDDVRHSTVLNLATQYHVDEPHTEHVARLALSLFDQLAALGLHAGDNTERELLWAACLLHDIGMTVGYDDHHKHSRYLVFHSGLPGFSQREVALIGQAVRYHRKGMPSLGPLATLMQPGDEKLLLRCALLLRLAEDLERSRDQAVGAVSVDLDSTGQLRLHLHADGEEVAVARWAADREDALCRRTFDHGLTIV